MYDKNDIYISLVYLYVVLRIVYREYFYEVSYIWFVMFVKLMINFLLSRKGGEEGVGENNLGI